MKNTIKKKDAHAVTSQLAKIQLNLSKMKARKDNTDPMAESLGKTFISRQQNY